MMDNILLISLEHVLVVLDKLKYLIIGLVFLRLASLLLDVLRIRKHFKKENLSLKQVLPAPFKRYKTIKVGSGRPYTVKYKDSNQATKKSLILTNLVKGVVFVEE